MAPLEATLATLCVVWLATHMYVPSKAMPKGEEKPAVKLPTFAPVAALSLVTPSPNCVVTHTYVPSKAMQLGWPPPTAKVPTTAPVDALTLSTLPTPCCATQTFAPSKAIPKGCEPTATEGKLLFTGY